MFQKKKEKSPWVGDQIYQKMIFWLLPVHIRTGECPIQADKKRSKGHFFFIFHSLSFFSCVILFILIFFFFFAKKLKLHQNRRLLQKWCKFESDAEGFDFFYSFFSTNSS